VRARFINNFFYFVVNNCNCIIFKYAKIVNQYNFHFTIVLVGIILLKNNKNIKFVLSESGKKDQAR
jgi:hypothetical protein